MEAKECERRYWELSERGELSRRERMTVRSTDKLLDHGLDAPVIAELARNLEKMGGVRRALLVRKALKHRPERPLFVLGVVSDTSWWKWTTRAYEKDLVARIGRECNPPGDTLIVSLRLNTAFRRPFRRVRGGEFYRRGKVLAG